MLNKYSRKINDFLSFQGAGRVAFSNPHSYLKAVSSQFVQIQHADIDKRVEIKPYVLDDQMCDLCRGMRFPGRIVPYFCAHVTCLQVKFQFNYIFKCILKVALSFCFSTFAKTAGWFGIPVKE